MQKARYIWDKIKNDSNIKKHKISFQEAATVFDDPDSITEYDEGHSNDEDRFSIIGLSANMRMLLVCHCYRNGDNFIRIISARKATKYEHDIYRRSQ